MPNIHVEFFAGRTLDQKRALAAALTDTTVRVLGGSPEHVNIIFTDVQRHDWATGGRLWSEPAAGATGTATEASGHAAIQGPTP